MNRKIMGFVALIILVGCGKSYGTGNGYSTSPISTSTVQEVDCSKVIVTGIINIQGATFSPANESITLQGIVKWMNNDLAAHTVTSGISGAPDGKFDVTLSPATVKCLKFTATGTFDYYSKDFTNMTAQVIVL